MIYFNVHRVLRQVAMVKQQQQIKQKTANYELLEDILNNIKIAVDDQKYNFQQYVNAAKAEGLSQAEIWTLAKETLQTHVSLRTLYRWAHEYLTEEAFMEVRQRASLSRKNIFADKWQQNLQQTVQQQIEGKEEPKLVEEYEYEKLKNKEYTYDYTVRVACWLHETLELNCKGK